VLYEYYNNTPNYVTPFGTLQVSLNGGSYITIGSGLAGDISSIPPYTTISKYAYYSVLFNSSTYENYTVNFRWYISMNYDYFSPPAVSNTVILRKYSIPDLSKFSVKINNNIFRMVKYTN